MVNEAPAAKLELVELHARVWLLVRRDCLKLRGATESVDDYDKRSRKQHAEASVKMPASVS